MGVIGTGDILIGAGRRLTTSPWVTCVLHLAPDGTFIERLDPPTPWNPLVDRPSVCAFCRLSDRLVLTTDTNWLLAMDPATGAMSVWANLPAGYTNATGILLVGSTVVVDCLEDLSGVAHTVIFNTAGVQLHDYLTINIRRFLVLLPDNDHIYRFPSIIGHQQREVDSFVLSTGLDGPTFWDEVGERHAGGTRRTTDGHFFTNKQGHPGLSIPSVVEELLDTAGVGSLVTSYTIPDMTFPNFSDLAITLDDATLLVLQGHLHDTMPDAVPLWSLDLASTVFTALTVPAQPDVIEQTGIYIVPPAPAALVFLTPFGVMVG